MARLFVFSDNLAARVELTTYDDGGEEAYAAICAGCNRTRVGTGDDLLADTHERWTLADAEQVATLHADGCTRCADPECHAIGRHDAGHRCRKH